MPSKKTIPSEDLGQYADSHAKNMEQVRSGLTESTVEDPTAAPDPVTEPAFGMAKEYENLYYGK